MDKHIELVANQIGTFIEYWGFKKVHGRIWALVFLAQKPVDANYLIKNLNISKALVSISLKELMEYNVLELDPSSVGTQKYTSTKDIVGVIFDVLINREAKMLLEIKSSCELLSRFDIKKFEGNATEDSISQLLGMTKVADNFLKSFLTLKSINLGSFKSALDLRDNHDD